MFVESMTFEEIRNEFEKDKLAVAHKIIAHSAKVSKLMRQTKISVYDKYFEYLSPRKNHWCYRLLFNPQSGHKGMHYGMYAWYYTKKGYSIVMYSVGNNRLTCTTGHFYKRYLQRTELQLEIVHDIIREFDKANERFVTHRLIHLGNHVWEIFSQMPHGVGLGYEHAHINLYELRTFISNNMLKGEQVQRSNYISEAFKMELINNH